MFYKTRSTIVILTIRLTAWSQTPAFRFVTLGASVNYSYWEQRTPQEETRDTRVKMHNLYLTTTFWMNRLHLGLEGIAAQVERGSDFYKTAVYTLESYLRIYKQAYLTAEYASANADEELKEGSSQQYKLGVKWFLAPGVEVQSQFGVDKFISDNSDDKQREYVATQLHLYY